MKDYNYITLLAFQNKPQNFSKIHRVEGPYRWVNLWVLTISLIQKCKSPTHDTKQQRSESTDVVS